MSIQFKRSSAINLPPEPAHLAPGELAINLADKKLYTKNDKNEVINIGFNADYAEATFLKLSGGALTGPVVLFEGTMPSKLDEIVSKRYVDSKFGSGSDQVATNGQLGSTYVLKSGDTMSGKLRLNYTLSPSDDQYHAVNKAFTESTYLKIAGGTVTGPVKASANQDSTLPGNAFITRDFANTTFINASGDTMEGALSLATAPTAAAHAVTKSYADNLLATMRGELNAAIASLNSSISSSKTGSWPINSIYISVSGANPRDELGFGTWELYAPGRVLVGAGTGTDIRGQSVVFNLGSAGGEYNHALTVNEMPAHNHSYIEAYDAGPTTGDGDNNSRWTAFRNQTTGNQGGNQAHNNIQPFMTVNLWRRIG